MKKKITRKMVKNSNDYIIEIGYCNAQTLLKCQNATSYCAGEFGWDCDNYDIYIDGFGFVTISTGYCPVKQKGINKEHNKINEIVEKYEKKARAIDYNGSYAEISKKTDDLLYTCIDEILNKEGDLYE